jgi:hypothetical protein
VRRTSMVSLTPTRAILYPLPCLLSSLSLPLSPFTPLLLPSTSNTPSLLSPLSLSTRSHNLLKSQLGHQKPMQGTAKMSPISTDANQNKKHICRFRGRSGCHQSARIGHGMSGLSLTGHLCGTGRLETWLLGLWNMRARLVPSASFGFNLGFRLGHASSFTISVCALLPFHFHPFFSRQLLPF